MKKSIIIFVVIGAVAFGGYQGYVALEESRKQKIEEERKQSILFYNDIRNFQENKVEKANDFKLENYHVTAPEYNNVEEAKNSLLAELTRLFPKGSDHKEVVYTLLDQGMASKGGVVMVGDLAGENLVPAVRGDTHNLGYKRIGFTKASQIKGLGVDMWHFYIFILFYDKDGKVLGFYTNIKEGNSKENAIYKGTVF